MKINKTIQTIKLVAKKWKKFPKRSDFKHFLIENNLPEIYEKILFENKLPVKLQEENILSFYISDYEYKLKKEVENKMLDICLKLDKYLEIEIISN